MKIIIPEPCHEDWDKMTPVDMGSFCGSCAKIVVDFTHMNDKEVINYFETHAQQKTCGRFLNTQVDKEISSLALPTNLHFTLPELQKVKSYTHRFIVALLIVFGNSLFISCGPTLGKVESPYSTGQIITIEDTTKQEVGTTKVTIKPLKKATKPSGCFDEILGDVIIEEKPEAIDAVKKATIKPRVLGASYMKGKPRVIPNPEMPEQIIVGESKLTPDQLTIVIDTPNKGFYLLGDTILPEQYLIDTTKKKGAK